jgi:hypothetical protein
LKVKGLELDDTIVLMCRPPGVPFRHPSAPREDSRAGWRRLAGFRCSEDISNVPDGAVRVAPLTTDTARSAATVYLPPGDRRARSPTTAQAEAGLEPTRRYRELARAPASPSALGLAFAVRVSQLAVALPEGRRGLPGQGRSFITPIRTYHERFAIPLALALSAEEAPQRSAVAR